MATRSTEQRKLAGHGRQPAPIHGFDAWTLLAKAELGSEKAKNLTTFDDGPASFEVRMAGTALWIVGRWSDGASVGHRVAYWPVGNLEVESEHTDAGVREYVLTNDEASFRISLALPEPGTGLLRVTVRIIPKVPLVFPFWPRDLYPLGEDDNPLASEGTVHAGQRGPASGLIYLSQRKPAEGTLLYFQNLSALNDYCRHIETELDSVVGGEWPQLGLSLPQGVHSALPQDEPVTLSDAFLRFTPGIPTDDELARVFLEGLAAIYPHLPQPQTLFHDWPDLARKTIHDLEKQPELTTRVQDHLYIRPYVGAEPPDSMSQLAVLHGLRRYEKWSGEPVDILAKLRTGLEAFFDEELGTLKRYLPTVDDNREPWIIDSWYLYHPMTNLARAALDGCELERRLVERAISYGIRVAHHFDYNWPVFFHMRTLEADQSQRKPGEPGESDVPGLYAYLMLQARDLFNDDAYLEEAKRALDSCGKRDFNIGYQFNNVAWGAAASVRLWRLIGDDRYLQRAQHFLASFFHNSLLWECEYGSAQHYPTFMGVKCLHDAVYMAIFEEQETFLALWELLAAGGRELPPHVQLLASEYCRYALHRAWYYYPAELPEEIYATEVRQGRIDRKLSIPLEDLYPSRQPVGQVGQEVYGCAAPMLFTAAAYHQLRGVDLKVFCDCPVLEIDEKKNRVLFQLAGDPRQRCRLRITPDNGGPVLRLRVTARWPHRGKKVKEESVEPAIPDDPLAYHVPCGASVEVAWDAPG